MIFFYGLHIEQVEISVRRYVKPPCSPFLGEKNSGKMGGKMGGKDQPQIDLKMGLKWTETDLKTD